MRGVLVILSIVGLMCLVGGVVANDLANSTITSTQTWVIANGNSQSTITVTAVDSNGNHQAGYRYPSLWLQLLWLWEH